MTDVVVYGYSIASIKFSLLTFCFPIAKAWDAAIGSQCIDVGKASSAMGFINAIADVVILVMPIPPLSALKMALPTEDATNLVRRDFPKLNQYSNLGDCQSDRNILYHAAPVSYRCYNLDDRTGALFVNEGTMITPLLFPCKNCNCGGVFVYDLGGTKRCINRPSGYSSFMLY
ncbi:hypothetical protein HJFPF1_12949 [Paramyrothecium foliicola]|nr:hypothetical protein HJFPF1_12949 [Paramyrothecium foliicola]